MDKNKMAFIDWYEKEKESTGRKFFNLIKFKNKIVKFVNEHHVITHKNHPPSTDLIGYLSFKLDDEDIKYLYEKYKPEVEKYKCKQVEKEITKLNLDLQSTKKRIKELQNKRCR